MTGELETLKFLERYIQPSRFLLAISDRKLSQYIFGRLSKCGAEVIVCETGDEALQATLARSFDLCMVDCSMDLYVKLIQGLKRYRKGLPIVLLVGDSDLTDPLFLEFGPITTLKKTEVINPFYFCDIFSMFKLRCGIGSPVIAFQTPPEEQSRCAICSEYPKET